MESNQTLHPSVEQFKNFVKEHPLLINEVRENRKSLQGLYEEWSVLGEQHDQWQAYRRQSAEQTNVDNDASQGTPTSLGEIMSMFKQMDIGELQNLLGQFSSVLENVQNVVQRFRQPQSEPVRNQQDVPFSFRRD